MLLSLALWSAFIAPYLSGLLFHVARLFLAMRRLNRMLEQPTELPETLCSSWHDLAPRTPSALVPRTSSDKRHTHKAARFAPSFTIDLRFDGNVAALFKLRKWLPARNERVLLRLQAIFGTL